MYRVYTASNFVEELKVILKNVNYSFELLISKNDILSISDSLFEILNKEVYSKIIISSDTTKKSIRIYNLINRLLDCGAEVFWNTDPKLFNLNSHFIIIDKTNIVNKILYNSSDNYEKQIVYFSEIFTKIISKSDQIGLKSEEIKVSFISNKSIVKPHELIKLSWKIENADFFEITPILESEEFISDYVIQIEDDTLFKLTASNHHQFVTKYIFIKVNKAEDINLFVKVYDPIIEEYIFLNPLIESGAEKYSCYYGQMMHISFHSTQGITLKEKKIGKLIPNEEYIFKAKKYTQFNFSYSLKGKLQFKKVEINVYKDDYVSQKLNTNQKQKQKIKRNKIIDGLKNFFNKLNVYL